MARRTVADDLVEFPWWLLLILATLVYVALKYWLPTFEFQNIVFRGFALALPNMAGFISAVLVFLAGVSAVRAWKRGGLLEKQTGIKSIQSLSWREFEFLVSEAYKRKGYAVQENSGAGPDGGVDLVLSKDGEKTLVQCKNWQSNKIGVPVVRELLGAMTAKGASAGIVVCSGEFTQPAKDFAGQNRIELVTGRALSKLISSVQTKQTSISLTTSASVVTKQEPISAATEAECPICGSLMVRRVAKKGKRAGNNFWGCSMYPKCRGTRDIQ